MALILRNICPHWLAALFSQYAIPLLFGASDGANLWLQTVFLYLPSIRYDGKSLCPSF